MRIRDFTPSDTAALVRIFQNAVKVLGSHVYPEPAVRAWLRAVDDIVAFEGRLSIGLTLVAETNDGQIAAFGQLHPGDCVNQLYCAPTFARRGYATAIYRQLEATADRQAITMLRTDASWSARPFFERQGSIVIATEHVIRHGAELQRFQMIERLHGPPP